MIKGYLAAAGAVQRTSRTKRPSSGAGRSRAASVTEGRPSLPVTGLRFSRGNRAPGQGERSQPRCGVGPAAAGRGSHPSRVCDWPAGGRPEGTGVAAALGVGRPESRSQEAAAGRQVQSADLKPFCARSALHSSKVLRTSERPRWPLPIHQCWPY